jgi:hypothetical protein
MNERILIPIITGIIGLITGLILPFVKWHVEKLRLKREQRILLINELRLFISSDDFDEHKFNNTVLYSRIRKYLPIKLAERIDNKDGVIGIIFLMHGERGGLQNELLDFIITLENKWKLI